MHSFERAAHAQEEHHEALLRELRMIDQVRIYEVLQVSAAIVREENVYGFGGRIGFV
jgi:hypothetical protein